MLSDAAQMSGDHDGSHLKISTTYDDRPTVMTSTTSNILIVSTMATVSAQRVPKQSRTNCAAELQRGKAAATSAIDTQSAK